MAAAINEESAGSGGFSAILWAAGFALDRALPAEAFIAVGFAVSPDVDAVLFDLRAAAPEPFFARPALLAQALSADASAAVFLTRLLVLRGADDSDSRSSVM
jgi:hypothetical protein